MDNRSVTRSSSICSSSSALQGHTVTVTLATVPPSTLPYLTHYSNLHYFHPLPYLSSFNLSHSGRILSSINSNGFLFTSTVSTALLAADVDGAAADGSSDCSPSSAAFAALAAAAAASATSWADTMGGHPPGGREREAIEYWPLYVKNVSCWNRVSSWLMVGATVPVVRRVPTAPFGPSGTDRQRACSPEARKWINYFLDTNAPHTMMIRVRRSHIKLVKPQST